MSSFMKRFKKKKSDSISAPIARTSILGAFAAPQVLPRVETPPPATAATPVPPRPVTPQVLPIVQTPAPPADTEYQAVVPTPQQNPPTPLQRLKAGGSIALHGLVFVAEGLKECSDLCPPLKTAAAVFLTVHKIFDGISTNKDELKELETRSEAILSLVKRYKAEKALDALKERAQGFSTAIESLVEHIKHLQDRPLPTRIAEVSNDPGIIHKMLRNLNAVCDLFQVGHQLADRALVSILAHRAPQIDIQLDTNVNVQSMLQLLNSRSIDKLRPESASYKTRRSTYGDPTGCMPGTRVSVLEKLEAWALDEQGAKVYWLVGMAGTGRSTIAQSLCEILNQRQMLGASFFCSRTSDRASDARLIVPGAAYDLANGSPTIKAEVVKALEKDPHLVELNDLQDQFTKLIVDPLRTAVGPGVKVYKIIVIDALDECKDPRFVSRLIQLILNSVSSLPLKFFLVSRADPSIVAAFNSSGVFHDTLVLHDIEKDIVESDIRVYVKKSLAEIKRFWNPSEEDGWPPDSELTRIIKASGKLFIYSSTAVRYIRDGELNYKRRLTALANRAWSRRQASAIDGLYGDILTQVCDGREEEELLHLETLLSFVVFLRHPLSINALSALSGISDPITYLSRLNSVIHVPTEENAPVSPFHASFPDFIMDPERCPPNRFSPFTPLRPSSAHADLALKCLELMNRSLRYNICDTPEELTISRMDRRNPPENAKRIPEALQYACVYWAVHLSEVRDSSQPILIGALREFLNAHLLHWMECLSVISQLKTGVDSLRSASDALSGIQTTDVKDLRSLADDARRFLQLGFECIEQNCFEVYQSAFTWVPKNSLMRRIYGAQAKQVARITLGLPDSWGPMELYIQGNSGIKSVAFSPDGTRVVYGSYGIVGIWNATTGALEAELEGHTGWVTSVAFSPDGTRVASGSDDQTVKIWNATTGALEVIPEGHTAPVFSVAFSPDGTRVASGSGDQTVRIWNATTGALEANLEGHTAPVSSVAFSPDGMRVASGSDDQTVRVWNATTGGLEVKLEGHTDSVLSVAFSPDGVRVASGLRDRTVRIWDATTGALEAKLEGHTDSVLSVAFSHDGTRIASGSDDQTVRIWNATTGGLEAKLEGHTSSVRSVAFSPDGMRVASGSDDWAVRIWNVTTGGLELKLEGHTSWVISVAFSPDGTRVASGSVDRTVRIWDAATGALEAILEGHTDSVWSVAFSPDGMRVASGSDDRTVRIWNVTKGALEARLEGHTDSVLSVAFSHDGMRVASGSDDRTVRIWNATTGVLELKLEGHADSVYSVAFSPDGTRVASGSDDQTVRIWNATTGALEAILGGHTAPVFSVAFSPDSTWVASGSHDRTVRIWNATTGGLEAKLEGHTGSVTSVAFSPDNTQVVASQSGRITVWNLTAEWPHILTNDSHNVGQQSHPLSLSDDGRWVVGAHHHCWIAPFYRGIKSFAFFVDKACFGYASGSLVILNLIPTA